MQTQVHAQVPIADDAIVAPSEAQTSETDTQTFGREAISKEVRMAEPLASPLDRYVPPLLTAVAVIGALAVLYNVWRLLDGGFEASSTFESYVPHMIGMMVVLGAVFWVRYVWRKRALRMRAFGARGVLREVTEVRRKREMGDSRTRTVIVWHLRAELIDAPFTGQEVETGWETPEGERHWPRTGKIVALTVTPEADGTAKAHGRLGATKNAYLISFAMLAMLLWVAYSITSGANG